MEGDDLVPHAMPEPTTPTSLLLNLLTQVSLMQGQLALIVQDREIAANERADIRNTVKDMDARLRLHDLTSRDNIWVLEQVRRWKAIEERARGGWIVLTVLWTIAAFVAGAVIVKGWDLAVTFLGRK